MYASVATAKRAKRRTVIFIMVNLDLGRCLQEELSCDYD
jgi:hypothetical protein